MAWAAFNGVGLALVLPCAQSIVADYYRPELRGRAFGFMFTMAALGARVLAPGKLHVAVTLAGRCQGRAATHGVGLPNAISH
jgi:MFS family permease